MMNFALRKMRTKKLLNQFCLLCAISSFAPLVFAELNKPRLNQDIQKTEQELEKKEKQRAQIESYIEKIDKKIAYQSKRLLDFEDDIKQLRTESNKLANEISSTQTQYAATRIKLSQYTRGAYMLGRQPFIKMLLNQEDAATTGRTLVYFDYFRNAYHDELGQISDLYTNQKNLEARNSQQLTRLETLLEKAVSERKDLESAKSQRGVLYSKLNANIDRVSRKLQNLYDDRKKLEALARELARASKPNSKSADDNILLSGEWPVMGKLLTRYGEPRVASGELKWDGVLIGSTEGDPVKAIADGHVVFSDWMRAYGYLTIIDHENGYMSLYGHNQMLLKKTGDAVKRHDIIGYVGMSGGQPQPALYFEIRRRGEPIDPSKWMSAHR